ncbi:MAG: hypothetical protein WD512_10605 [Candidatus Paceibacterota bacterium]
MAIELISNRNMSEGIHVVLVYINDITGGVFVQMLLLAIWCIFAIGLYFQQSKNTGLGDFPMTCAVAGFITFMLATLLRLIDGLVSNFTYGIVIAMAVLGVAWFYFSKEKY